VPEPSEILTPLEAALHLGITPGLLFGYTSVRFRKSPSQLRHLETIELAGKTRFAKTTLEDFDRYLKEPWADIGAQRTDPPKCILDHLRAESGNQCIRCASGIGVQTAHIVPWAISRSHHPDNLIRICAACHLEHDEHNSLPTAQLIALKQQAQARLRANLAERLRPVEPRFNSPCPDTLFVGRTRQLTDLREALRTSRSTLIHGPGGIGKTQLLLRALPEIETGLRVIWIDVERFRTIEGIRSALHIFITEEGGAGDLDAMAVRLDALNACVVLDGLERLCEPSIDDIDDMLAQLMLRSNRAQFVVTSQVTLQRATFDEYIELAGLDRQFSRKVFRRLVRDSSPVDHDSESELLSFADGHPLALRLTAALVNYFGSGRSALEQIKRRGASTLQLQKRVNHDSTTSLGVCLSLAYEKLEPVEQRLLYVIASCPGGIFTKHLELNERRGLDPTEALAALRRWNLVQLMAPGETFERLYILSPIASYVGGRWRLEHPSEADALLEELLRNFAMMVAVVDKRAEDPAEIPYMLERYTLELPNILRILDAAEAQPGNAQLSLFAAGICSSLMRFFFILRLPEQGVKVMQRGAQIALRDGHLERASSSILQMVALAARTHDSVAIAAGQTMLNSLEGHDTGAEISGNIALTRAVICSNSGDSQGMEKCARLAIVFFEAARDQFDASREGAGKDDGANSQLERINNDLASAFGLLGGAHLAQARYNEAREAYRRSLSLQSGGSVPVNEGQTLHQIGNCESNLKNYAEAVRCYADAALRFHALGMREYLSNALGELGYTVIDLDGDASLPDTISPSLLSAGAEDIADDVARCFGTNVDLAACASVVRKLFGVIVLISLSKEAESIGALGQYIDEQIVKPFKIRSPPNSPISNDGVAHYHLDMLAVLALSIAAFEQNIRVNVSISGGAVARLAAVCFHQGPMADLQNRSFDWLSIYLRRKWPLPQPNLTADALRDACARAETGDPFEIPPLAT
jgi:tetratricopeptide (TPR) repeat protein